MASRPPQSGRTDPAEALARLERPTVRWKAIVQIVLAFAVIWIVALMVVPWVGYWGVGAAGLLTLLGLGFGLYIWRITRKSAAIVDLLKGATDEAGRREAIARLEKEGKDALAALARAQLVAAEDPTAAIDILEAIEIEKAPLLVQDDIRANLALLYLMRNKARRARELVEQIRLDRQAQPKSRALAAAVKAEALARTGAPKEALELMEHHEADDPEFVEVRAMLLRARVYTFHANKKRGLMRKAMEQLAAERPEMLAPFVARGQHPDIVKAARHVLQRAGAIPRTPARPMR